MNIPNPVQYAAWVDLNLCDLRRDARFHGDDEVASLLASMNTKQLQNIIVCRTPSPSPLPGERTMGEGNCRYEVIVGVGRLLAARKGNWTQIRADVYEGLTELQKLDMVFSENEDRQNASPLYQAKLLDGMMKAGDLTQEQLGEQIGKTSQSVGQYVGLLALSPKILENENMFSKFGLRHFKQLLRIENKDDQWKLAEMTREKDLSSSELSALVDKQLGRTPAKKAGRPKGDKKVGAEGFAFSQKGGRLRIKANIEYNEDADAIADLLKIALRTWQISHPVRIAASAK